MNIFILSDCPKVSAEMMCDKHIVKMPTESMQMISTIMELYGFSAPMKPVMLNHPCTKWARESSSNFGFLVDHCLALCKEYTARYGKKHKVETYLEEYEIGITDTEYFLKTNSGSLRTPFAQAMPDKYKNEDAVKAYRDYYLGDKWDIATWKLGNPNWWPNDHIEIKKQEMIDAFNKTFNAGVKNE